MPDAGAIFSPIDFGGTGRILVAVSGGSDSTALLLLAFEHFAMHDDADRLIAATVDHGLRAEAAGEAESVGALCAARGVEHRIVRWQDEKPVTGMQNAARKVRYRLLADAARDAGASIVLTGHTFDDQIETVTMRGKRGTGRGLSGIAPATLYRRSCWFVRPLLAERRSVLRDYLAARQCGWIDDPSNANPAFERVRTRTALEGCDPTEIERRAVEADAARRSEAAAAARFVADRAGCRFDRVGRSVEFDASLLRDGEVNRLALAAMLAWIGCCDYLPAAPIVEKAALFCREAENGRRLTVSGCLMEKKQDAIRILREPRNRRGNGFAFDELVPAPDYELAAALAGRTGSAPGPRPPLRGYLD